MKDKRNKTGRKGSALLVVLFIVMAITILSLGFLSRSDVELACGENMILKTQMDYLAESGLEHARGLILNDNNFSEGNWQLSDRLYDGNDYYDVNVVKLGECNYKITCDAYREKGIEKIGRSSLEAELRLDPCIALWMGRDTTVSSAVTINGDVYCNGTLTNNNIINGDVFANSLSGSGSITGRQKTTGDLLLARPQVTVGDFISHYSVQTIDTNTLDSNSLGGSSQVCYRNSDSDLELAGNVQIEGMLIVDANLTITGNGNVITAGKNLPAMLVTGDLIIEDGGQLAINGLAVVNGGVQIGGTTSITGGLFVENGIVGAGSITITAAPSKTAIITWSGAGVAERWGQASGAFFKSIGRL